MPLSGEKNIVVWISEHIIHWINFWNVMINAQYFVYKKVSDKALGN